MKIFKTLLLSTLIIGLQTACVSLSGSDDKKAYDQPHFVHQTTGKDVLTRMSRDHWIEVRKSASSERMKLYATLATKDWQVAGNDARAFLREHPKDRVALSVLATALAMQQNYDLAAYYARLLEKYHPGFPETDNLMGLAILNKPGATYQDFQEAARYFEQAFDSHSHQVASGLNLGHLHLEMANAEAARSVFQIVKNRCGDCVEASMGFAIANTRLERYDEAQDNFEEIIDENPGNIEAQYYLALIATYGKNNDQKAMRLLTDILDQPRSEHLEIQRKANFLLRRLQARYFAPEQRRYQISEQLVPVSN